MFHPSRRRPSWPAVVLVLITALGAVLGAPAQTARAHAQLLSSDPANGARLDEAPAEITMRFSEGLILVTDGIRLLGPQGPVKLPGKVRIDPAVAQQVIVPLPAELGPGVYTVAWRVVSADSHPIHGALVFGVGDVEVGQLPAAGALTDTDGALSTVFAACRWLGYAGLGLLGGGGLFLVVCWPAGWSGPRVRRTLAAAFAASLVSALALVPLQGSYAAGRGLRQVLDAGQVADVLGTTYGISVLARAALVLIGGGLLLAASRATGSRLLGAATALTLLVALPATWIGTGHANAEAGIVAVVVGTGHVTAMAAWLGGLVFLLLVLGRGAPVPAAEADTVFRRFSLIATVSVVVLAVTGLHRAWQGVGTVEALTGSRYGVLLVLKLAAVGVLVWAGSVSRSVVRRRARTAPGGSGRTERQRDASARRQLRLSLRIETVFAVAVLAVTAVLVATPPGARPEAAQPTVRKAALELTKGGRALLELDPARTGTSSLTVAIRAKDGTAWDVPEVSATLTLPEAGLGPLQVKLTKKGPGRYASTGLLLPRAGEWTVRLSVRSSDIDMETLKTELPVG